MNALKIEQTQEAQLLASLEIACFGNEAWSAEMLKSCMDNSFRHAYLLTDEGEAVAYCIMQIIFGEGEILRIGTSPNHRKKKYAKKLLKELLETQNLESCFLEVHAANEAAKALYKSCGFIVTGKREGYYSDGFDAITMEWKRLTNE